MPLIGQAKTDYQREYMRRRRSAVRPTAKIVRPFVRPEREPLTKERQLSRRGFND